MLLEQPYARDDKVTVSAHLGGAEVVRFAQVEIGLTPPWRRSPSARWRRVVLKLSGEAFAEPSGYRIDGEVVNQLAGEIVDARRNLDVDVAVVVGGGNIWRGMTGGAGMDRAKADYMGMLATVINALALQDALERSTSPPGSRPPSRWRRSPSRTSAGGPSATWRRGGW